MKRELAIADWKRKEHFEFFCQFEEPFFGVTVNIEVTKAYNFAKNNSLSFFLLYLHKALKAVNETEEFRYRIIDGKVFVFDRINASPTINREDGTFGFAYMDYEEDEHLFYAKATEVIARVRREKGLVPAVSGENVIHFSAVPWLHFTALSHARSFSFADSSPKISFGKVLWENGKAIMPVSIHAHHGLMDGYHVGLFASKFQELMNAY
ncbi:Chloramphenicol acetyltransferase 3 [compost metagenome]